VRSRETLDQSNLSDPGATYKDLELRYCEPHRHFHTLTGLAQCLDLLLQSRNDSPVLRVAIYYHDIVYGTHRQDNESASAELAGEQLAKLGCPATRRKEICSLILATSHLDNAQAVSKIAHVLCDIDLAILGSPLDDYDLYAKQIRCEYDWVSSEEFHAGRSVPSSSGSTSIARRKFARALRDTPAPI
jgi:predicted metal-dependent HD superfamily phosphohydrolase